MVAAVDPATQQLLIAVHTTSVAATTDNGSPARCLPCLGFPLFDPKFVEGVDQTVLSGMPP